MLVKCTNVTQYLVCITPHIIVYKNTLSLTGMIEGLDLTAATSNS